jgi:hypothetical protein
MPGSLNVVNTSGLTPGALNLVVGRPGTEFDFDQHSGVRLTGGAWLDPAQQMGVEFGYFILERRTINLSSSSLANQLLGRPYFDPIQSSTAILQLARPTPGAMTGGANVDGDNSLWGLEANVRIDCTVFSDRTDFVIGFRHLQLSESLTINSFSNGVPGDPFTSGSSYTSFEQFGTHNQFYGPQFGIAADRRYGDWFLDIAFKLGLGLMHEVVNINGFSTAGIAGGPTATAVGAMLALPSNIGHYSRDRFAAIPELTLTLGRQLTPRLRAAISYNFLYLSDVVRPGDQINLNVDSRTIPFGTNLDPSVPPGQPQFGFQTAEFWAQGINFSLEFRY